MPKPATSNFDGFLLVFFGLAVLVVIIILTGDSQENTGIAVLPDQAREIQVIYTETNKNRDNPLQKRQSLIDSAHIRAKTLCESGNFSHDGWQSSYLEDFDHRGENLARGYKDGKSTVRAWMDSKTHRENIQFGEFKYIGVGYYRCGDSDYYVQHFGG